MRLNAYCIYDEKAGVFQRPIFLGADGEAIRVFCDIAGDETHPVGKHPEDYLLRRVGHFDDNSAIFVSDISEVLVTGLDAVMMSEQSDINKVMRAEKQMDRGPVQ